MLNAAAIAQMLGGRREGSHFMARCPAHPDKTPSLALKDGQGRVLVHCHGGCTQEAVIAALTARGLWQGYEPIRRSGSVHMPKIAGHSVSTASVPTRAQAHSDGNERNLDRALDIWCAARDPRGTLAEAYLKSRELELPEWEPARVLRYHPRCPLRGAHYPALVALFTAIDGDEPRGIHRIALNADPEVGPDLAVRDAAGKALKLMLGPVGSAAVKLSTDEDVNYGLGIAEGIETALARYTAGWRPIWALGSAAAIAAFPVLSGIDALTVWADNDTSRTGAKAAKACVNRWVAAGREAKGLETKALDTDWADEWSIR